jgi:phage terminase small subunit
MHLRKFLYCNCYTTRNMTNPQRYDRLIEELPKHNYVIEKAAIAAGFARSTARSQQNRLMKAAMKRQMELTLDKVTSNAIIPISDLKSKMSDIVGMSVEEVMKRLKTIATQDKDLGSALKVLVPLAKEHGVVLHADEQSQVIVPVLNVTMEDVKQSNDQTPVIHDEQGSTDACRTI